jgi:hypothetical protein
MTSHSSAKSVLEEVLRSHRTVEAGGCVATGQNLMLNL